MPRQIESLEAERFDALPGPTIARGMVPHLCALPEARSGAPCSSA